MVAVVMRTRGLRIRIQNFKSIEDATVDLRPGLNILIGPNGSGKTNFLSALKFVRDFILHGAARAVAFAGGPRSVYNRGASVVSITLSLPYGDRTVRRRKTPVSLSWTFSVTQSKGEVPVVNAEQVRLESKRDNERLELFNLTRNGSHAGRPERRVAAEPIRGRDLFNGWRASGKNRREQIERVSRYLDEFGKAIAGDTDHSMLPGLAEVDAKFSDLVDLVWALNEYNILPDIARAPTEPAPYAHMRPDGAGMSEVVHALTEQLFYKLDDSRRLDVDQAALRYWRYYPQRAHYYGSGYQEYIVVGRRPRKSRSVEAALESIVRELVSGVTTIDGVATQLDHNTGKRFAVFTAGSNRFLPHEVSDGTIKWLCILISLFVPRSAVYLLEEPENFLHPWMQ